MKNNTLLATEVFEMKSILDRLNELQNPNNDPWFVTFQERCIFEVDEVVNEEVISESSIYENKARMIESLIWEKVEILFWVWDNFKQRYPPSLFLQISIKFHRNRVQIHAYLFNPLSRDESFLYQVPTALGRT